MVTIDTILQKLLDTIPSGGCQTSYVAHLELIKYFADKLEAGSSQQASCESQDWIPASVMPQKHDNIEIVLGTGEIVSGKVTEIELHGSRLDLLIVNKENFICDQSHIWWTGLEPGVARQTRVKWRPTKS